jgi:hypothetical protein
MLDDFANNAYFDVLDAPSRISSSIYMYHMSLALEAKFAILKGETSVANNYIYELHRSMRLFTQYVKLYGMP